MILPMPGRAGIMSSSPNIVFAVFFIAENQIDLSKAPGLDGANFGARLRQC